MVHPSDPIPRFPPADDLETVAVFKALNYASRALGTLKGQACSIPNQGILIDTLALQKQKSHRKLKTSSPPRTSFSKPICSRMVPSLRRPRKWRVTGTPSSWVLSGSTPPG